MEVILLERIEKLGQMGDVVVVKPGYARNYLLPQKKALPATDGNKAEFEQRRAQLEAENLEHKKEADAVAEKMEGTFIAMVRQAGEAGQLYGSVNARDIADGLADAGFTVNRNQIRLAQPIKSVGLHSVLVSLHPEVAVAVTANVARSEDEADVQERTGEAVVASEERQAEAEAAVEAEIVAAAEEVGESLETAGDDGPNADNDASPVSTFTAKENYGDNTSAQEVDELGPEE